MKQKKQQQKLIKKLVIYVIIAKQNLKRKINNIILKIRSIKVKIGRIYNVVFSTGKYEIEYENNVKCIKITPKSYRVERQNGTRRLIRQDFIKELKEV
jgi:hypothetical protein